MTQASPEPYEPPPAPEAEPDSLRPVAFEDEVNLRDLVLKVWRGKWIVLATVTVVLALVTLWMKASTPRYTASMVVAPAEGAGTAGLAGRLSQYAGLASLAGIRLPAEETVSPFTQFNELITSVTVAERLQEKHGVLQEIFERFWDPADKRWVPPQGRLSRAMAGMRRFFSLPPWTPPSPGALADFIEGELKVSTLGRSGMREIKFSHKDPTFAVQFLRWLHEEGDALVREEALKRTSRQIAYLNQKLATVTMAEYRLSLTQILSDQEKQMMMIQVDLPFAARIIEPPIVSDAPTSPRPFFFLALGTAAGLAVGIFLVFLIDALRASPARTRSP